MKTRTVRLSVDLLEKLAEKFIAEGRPAEMVNDHLGVYINELLWKYVGIKASLEWDAAMVAEKSQTVAVSINRRRNRKKPEQPD